MLTEILDRYTAGTQIAAALFGMFFLILLLRYLTRLYPGVKRRFAKTIPDSENPVNVSVLVVVYDNIRFIRTALPRLLEQKYKGRYEVIVVNHSPKEPATTVALEELRKKYPHLYVTELKAEHQFKSTNKLALSLGIKAAKYEHILIISGLTGDYSPNWLTAMSRGFRGERCIVTGYSNLKRRKGFANQLFRCTHIFNAIGIFARAAAGKPYRVIGSNMGFTKQMFYENKGFGGHANINLGERDLFIQQMAPYARTSVVLDPEATNNISQEFSNLRKWYIARGGELLMFPYYTARAKRAMLSVPIFLTLFYASAALLITLCTLHRYWDLLIAAGSLLLILLILLILLYRRFGRATGTHIPAPSMLLYNFYQPIDTLVLFLIWKFYYTKKRIWR